MKCGISTQWNIIFIDVFEVLASTNNMNKLESICKNKLVAKEHILSNFIYKKFLEQDIYRIVNMIPACPTLVLIDGIIGAHSHSE